MVKQRVYDLERKPHFFKVLIGDFARCLRIPPAFRKHLLDEASNRVVLEGPNGSIWHVELHKTINDMYLRDGWQNFIEDHSLRGNEFLVFRYDDNMHFSVQIFDENACEREHLFTSKTSQESSLCPSRKQGERSTKSLGFVRLSQKKSCKLNYSNSVGGRYTPSKPSGLLKNKTKDADLPICKIGSYTRRRTRYMSRRRPVTAKEKEKAEKAAKSLMTTYPSFITHMKVCNVYKTFILNIPYSFAKEHLPNKKTEMVLRDPNGKAWTVNLVPSKGKLSLCGGWGAFSRGNHLEEGDFCVFELMSGKDMRVYIFRLVKKITPLVPESEKVTLHRKSATHFG